MLIFNNYEGIWLIVGFIGQGCFFLRFLIQRIAFEGEGKSTIPVVFWHLSVLGAISMLVYAIARKDPVFITGQSMGLIVYTRNLMLIYRQKAQDA